MVKSHRNQSAKNPKLQNFGQISDFSLIGFDVILPFFSILQCRTWWKYVYELKFRTKKNIFRIILKFFACCVLVFSIFSLVSMQTKVSKKFRKFRYFRNFRLPKFRLRKYEFFAFTASLTPLKFPFLLNFFFVIHGIMFFFLYMGLTVNFLSIGRDIDFCNETCNRMKLQWLML